MRTIFPTVAGPGRSPSRRPWREISIQALTLAAAGPGRSPWRKTSIRALSLAVAALAMGAKAWSHHSFAAVYLEDQEVTIEGRLVQFLWRNPHTLVHVMVEQEDGSNVRYVVEWGSATQLGATGVTQATLRPGDHVVINGNPGRNAEDNRVRLLNFLRPSDGLTWGLRPDEVFD